ncbi:hypothetical protein QR680_013908 [Steinernema hermaphroditum]|uniref:Cathepsin L-like n=1 Tax=Steinernema hermaphroditum TaxID=289476 RepID=A0AA39I734_9BILA|nr:hypothetical protein QR680_013908 [Steinernema hermaphroditum]
MRKLLFFLLLVGIAALSSTLKSDDFEAWELFKSVHEKVYPDPEDDYLHMLAFLQNRVRINSHSEKSFSLGLNHLADMTPEEYRKLNRAGKIARTSQWKGVPFKSPSNVEIPDSIDWRDHGFVTEVKNQGQCGSCWAFSATGALEGQHKRASGKLVSLSEQNLLDCTWGYNNEGCDGGWPDAALQYVKDNGGVDTEEGYPYIEEDGEECLFNKSAIGTREDGFVALPQGDEEALMKAVATVGPVSVVIDATYGSFQLYKGGVFYDEGCSDVDLNHAVLVVGYGTDPKEGDYWIVKNSWGAGWGEKGYIRMARNRENNCGIATVAVYPVIKADDDTNIAADFVLTFVLVTVSPQIMVALACVLLLLAICCRSRQMVVDYTTNHWKKFENDAEEPNFRV